MMSLSFFRFAIISEFPQNGVTYSAAHLVGYIMLNSKNSYTVKTTLQDVFDNRFMTRTVQLSYQVLIFQPQYRPFHGMNCAKARKALHPPRDSQRAASKQA